MLIIARHSVKENFDLVRCQVYSTHNIWQDLKNWKRGLSAFMCSIRSDLESIRLEITVSRGTRFTTHQSLTLN